MYLLIFLRDSLTYNKFLSSAKSWVIEYTTVQLRSLIIIMNRRGPRTDPCGTPCVIKRFLEKFPLIDTY